MNRLLAFPCVIAISALSLTISGCNKGGSQNGNAASDAAASGAASQPPAASGAVAASGAAATGMLGNIAKAQLPAEATETLKLIKSGGPFPYSDDGVLFRNSAQLLPKQPRGYYHLYTVRTPGAADRGQRRIVCGGARKQTSECYYTEDYYASFRRISD